MAESVAPVVDRTSLPGGAKRSPRRMYAASACGALAGAFAATSLAVATVAGSRSRIARENAVCAVVALLAATALRLSARPVPMRTVQPIGPAPDVEPPSLDYSIIVPVYNRANELRTLCAALAEIVTASARAGNGELLIVDDGSQDDTAAVAADLGATMPIATRVLSKPNGGVSSARNAGFRAARGKIGVVIDSDCIPEATWLDAMLAAVRSDPKLLVFARIRRPKRPIYPLENLPDTKGFVGASFAIERDAYLGLGGCYERYGASHDDRDLVLTALRSGFDAAHATGGWITHPLRRETVRSMWRAGLNSRFGNLFAQRHGEYAAQESRPTPYYFFGIGSHYGSSIAFVVAAANIVLLARCVVADPQSRRTTLACSRNTALLLCIAYVLSLATLGLLTRAPLRQLPAYVTTLATFQLATFVGRLRGTFEYGILLL